jgi:hypothetical protein
MLAFRFSLHIKMKVKGKCPKHPRFNPEMGEGAIRGGCPDCSALYQVVEARDRATRALREFEDLATPYRVLRKARKPLKARVSM